MENQIEQVLKFIQNEITVGRLLPGDRLPAERRLSDKLGIQRSHIRNAYQKLKLYGIVETKPQSGTVLVQEKIQILGQLITDVLKMDQYDFLSLVNVRLLLEKEAFRLCALNRTDADLALIKNALTEYEQAYDTIDLVPKDFSFHQAIARGSQNPVLASLLLVITPDVQRYFNHYQLCTNSEVNVLQEHIDIYNAIKERNPDKAVAVLEKHLYNLLQFAIDNNDNIIEFEID